MGCRGHSEDVFGKFLEEGSRKDLGHVLRGEQKPVIWYLHCHEFVDAVNPFSQLQVFDQDSFMALFSRIKTFEQLSEMLKKVGELTAQISSALSHNCFLTGGSGW